MTTAPPLSLDDLHASVGERVKEDLKYRLLHAAGMRRIHIIGCARSGTTMLQYAMVAFADTILPDAETRIWSYPSLGQALGLVARYGLPRRPRHLVTKRAYGWFRTEEVHRLLYSTLRHRFFVLHVVRDPRDVLTSRKGDRDLYVELERWQDSAAASARILEALRAAGYTAVLTVRYEDVVSEPERTALALMSQTGLRLRPGIASWATLAGNLQATGQSANRAKAMHAVRNFDPASVGRWRRDPTQVAFVRYVLDESPARDDVRRFMAAYGYPIEASTLAVGSA